MSPAPSAVELDSLAARLGAVTIGDRHRLERRVARARRDTSAGRGKGDRGGELTSLRRAVEAAEARRAAREAAVPAVGYPAELPVSAHRQQILEALSGSQVVVVAGETGSGKTTQLPKMCLELGRGVDGMIGHTQPRRIAARTVAERLAEELAVPLGGAVGYAVRFADTVGETTLVKVMTDGLLLAELRRDRLLTAYDTIIVDEAHERSLNIDFLLGFLGGLLPRRPELKVLVTSATIDTARFAAHFRAPVVEVSGRSHPVEIRYRPLDPAGSPSAPAEGRDPNQALVDAVFELTAEGPGDVLVFLPGERDIRDAAEALAESGPAGIEIVPLYARLSAAEQHRVFQPHRARRVVLATNVAETSLTVPGIGYVVDTGLARISRYSHRSKVQRLPIEPVSQASADQRAGRCGRTGPGICIRLYSEQDYESRPRYTDPEILRTNLAAVILQMAAIGLGEIERFPFLEPPDRRSVADGRALLEELGAVERRGGRLELTAIGRRLAELPLDPRLGRMILEAERRGCLREVTVIAAALSIQDPRERPLEAAAAADELHRRFAVEGSDFLAYLRLWDYLAGLQAELSRNQFRRRCRAELLNVLRVREWQDVAGQVRQVLRSAGVHANSEPAPPDAVHQSLLSGLLSQIGVRDRLRGDYLGARNTRWRIARSSSLARSQPPWAMAADLVETDKTWARTVAAIDPRWAEHLGTHLAKRSHSEPWWEPGRGEAACDERVTLYGLPVVTARRVSLARLDPAAARAMFVERALVERDWPVRVEPLDRNAARLARVARLQERVRRHLLAAGGEALFGFYDARLPAEVTGGRAFERWWRRVAGQQPDLLDIPFSLLLDPAAGPLDLDDYPDHWHAGPLELALRYRWEPGAVDDGVTVEIPLVACARVSTVGFDWHVPGFRAELVTELIRTLPKALRRAFVPAADVAAEVLAGSGPGEGPIIEVLARRLSSRGGLAVSGADFDPEALPAHLRLRFEIIDDGRALASGHDLGHLLEKLRPQVRAALSAALPGTERHGLERWDFGDLPRRLERGSALGFPAFVDEGERAGVVLLESPAAQEASSWAGERRLILLSLPVPTAHLERRLTNDAKLSIARSGVGVAELAGDCAAAVADRLLHAAGGPLYEQAAFESLLSGAAGGFADRVIRVTTIAAGVLAVAARLEERAALLERRHRRAGPPDALAEAVAAAIADVRRQSGRLVHPGFVSEAGSERLGDLLRYLEAAGRRLQRLPADARRDAARLAVLARLESRYERLLAATSYEGPPLDDPRREVGFLLEELRVSLWAQELGTRVPVSEQRVERAIRRLEE